MTKDSRVPIDRLIESLQERDKELNCLYKIEELLSSPGALRETVFEGAVAAIPPAFQYPDWCRAKIVFEGQVFAPRDFRDTPWVHTADIIVQKRAVGSLSVFYVREMPSADVGPFLKEEIKLIHTIADRLGQFVQYQQLRTAMQQLQSARQSTTGDQTGGWRVVLDLLQRTDQNLVQRLSRKMLIRLSWHGVHEAEVLFQSLGPDRTAVASEVDPYENRPSQKSAPLDYNELSKEVFDIAAAHMKDDEILSWVQRWIQEDRSSFLVKTLASYSSSHTEIADALRRFDSIAADEDELTPSTRKEIRVSLIRRFFTEQLDFINVAKDYVKIEDFTDLLNRIIYPPESHGQLGGKSAGLFLATRILEKHSDQYEVLRNIKTPKTWHITSDALLSFVSYNNLEDLFDHRYKDLDQIRREYPQIVQLFKHSSFTPEIIQGLSMALDDFEDHPLIVRSSSLLEDRVTSAFSGKYKSLFLANQGSKARRLEALMDAVAEVYSSTFGPDPIEYRAERGLLDFPEEMGIMIQEVVGRHIGPYFMPLYAGVAFSNNEFRWSPRIRRDDGLIRLVMGLGTRAVDRLSDDYPVLIAPGQPGLRANITCEDIVHYSPNKIDIINLEKGSFETVGISDFLSRHKEDIPDAHQLVSVCRDHHISLPSSALSIDADPSELVVTFEGLVSRTPFVKKMHTILHLLQEKLGTPVDIEFACDGEDFYLLQCRPQGYAKDSVPMPIPRDLPHDQILFTAHRYVSNGKIPDITYLVYVDPQAYSDVQDLQTLTDIGRAVGRLNSLLPKYSFILMGPGRWGSRGDIKLGVSVTYSEIKNTAALIEIARQKGNYVPDLSFGTHFFQDLVESSIRYLPLYPDDPGVVWNEAFFKSSKNLLPTLLPQFQSLADVVHVIDVPQSTGGKIVRIHMNAELDEAIAFLAQPGTAVAPVSRGAMTY
jgi:pyruvate,water dikinase